MPYETRDIKSEAISIRLQPEELRILKCLARAERQAKSELMRELLRAEARRRGLWPSPAREGSR